MYWLPTFWSWRIKLELLQDYWEASTRQLQQLQTLGLQFPGQPEEMGSRRVVAKAKRAGSQLKNRIVAEKSIAEWSRTIENMEDQVSDILQEEREERALRKAEMEATKAENMITHKDEIFSRPKRTWFVTEREKKLIAKAAKASIEKNQSGMEQLISAEQAEEIKKKEKRQREREKNLPRKKRRRLEAAREMADDDNETDDLKQVSEHDKKGKSLVDVAYGRAKSIKAIKKARDAGKITRKFGDMHRHTSKRKQTRKEEMLELFENDMSESKQQRIATKSRQVSGKKKSSSFKSKSRVEVLIYQVGRKALSAGTQANPGLQAHKQQQFACETSRNI
ncbi:hypothetical protein Taro_035144 [Colocasia esculenta]|uniref:Uncharacterized protein n=1 Tax=Colocasia esculenta TaxID=4460 RepID=A0A843W5T5_COLES|nr:hypothetical protein [Colocasia esculenta]